MPCPQHPQRPFADEQHAHFANRLRQWGEDRGVEVKEVAAQFGVAQATCSRW